MSGSSFIIGYGRGSRHRRLLAGGVLALAWVTAATWNCGMAAGACPNIIVLLADDLGWHDTGFSGHPQHRTPNLDRLRAQSMSFTEAHAAAPICSASRVALLTGLTPARLHYEFVPKFAAGEFRGEHAMQPPPFPTELPAGTATVGSRLRGAGYTTAFMGKWHLNRHFRHYLGWRPGCGPESFGFDHCVDDFGAHPYGYPGGGKELAEIMGDGFPVDTLSDAAIRFIRQDHRKPFLLWFSFYQVHDPFHSRCRERVAYHLGRLPAGAAPKRAHYAAMVETLDHEVGRILAALDASGRAADTMIVFTSDNGGHPEVSANGPLRGSKWNLYQGGIRVPLLVRWPGMTTAGAACPVPVIGTDLAATLAEAAGAPAAKSDGRSLVPLLRGEAPDDSWRDRPLTWHFPYYQPETRFEAALDEIGVNDFAVAKTRPHAAMRSGPYKLIHHFETSAAELYQLDKDPSEAHDLSAVDPERAREMRARLLESLHEQGARLPRRRDARESKLPSR